MFMNELMLSNQNEVSAIDSREVAEMLGKEHKEVMRDIRRISLVLESGNFPPSDYFIENTYINKQNKQQPCFLVTKIGCEVLGNKLQGEKGILFTASYVKKFNDMEKQLKSNLYSYMIEDPVERALKWAKEMKQTQLMIAEKNEIIEELSPLAELARKRIDKTGTVSLTDVTKSFNLKKGQITVWAKKNGFIHKTIKEVNNKGDEYFRVVCPDGEHKGIAITEEGLKYIDKNIEEIKNSPCRYKN